jgi:hypothetical protein
MKETTNMSNPSTNLFLIPPNNNAEALERLSILKDILDLVHQDGGLRRIMSVSDRFFVCKSLYTAIGNLARVYDYFLESKERVYVATCRELLAMYAEIYNQQFNILEPLFKRGQDLTRPQIEELEAWKITIERTVRMADVFSKVG